MAERSRSPRESRGGERRPRGATQATVVQSVPIFDALDPLPQQQPPVQQQPQQPQPQQQQQQQLHPQPAANSSSSSSGTQQVPTEQQQPQPRPRHRLSTQQQLQRVQQNQRELVDLLRTHMLFLRRLEQVLTDNISDSERRH
eukprot:15439086-Alexandrium_andersonii.AAC.1